MRVDWFEVARAVQSHGRERDAEPRQASSAAIRERRTKSCRAPRRSSRTSRMRAFRRPLAEEDIARAAARTTMTAARTAAVSSEASQFALAGILASPHFLYRAEQAPRGVTAGTYRITDLELASRLSFFLWSTIPDDELRDVAARNELREPAVAARSRSSACSRTRVRSHWPRNFAYPVAAPREARRPRARSRIVSAVIATRTISGQNFIKEITLFVDSVFREDRSVIELLTADYTFLNESLATHYGINHVTRRPFPPRRAARIRPLGAARQGRRAARVVLSEPDVAGAARRVRAREHHRRAARDAARQRRDQSRRRPRAAAIAVTVREKLAAHSTNPTCHACHGSIDPLGFALENFDVDGTLANAGSARRASPSTRWGRCPTARRLEGPERSARGVAERPRAALRRCSPRSS